VERVSVNTHSRYLLEDITRRLKEERMFLQVIAGPRQVGKTTMCRQIAAQWKGLVRYHTADSALRPDGEWIDGAWDALRKQMEFQQADEAVLIIDEVQKVENWSEAVKKNWDYDTMSNINIKTVILGSSRLLIKRGLSESLLGRFELNVMGHWSYHEMKSVFGFTPEQYAYFGAYPGAAKLIENEKRFKDYISASIIESVVSKDILQLTQVNKPALLRQAADVAIAYSSQIVSYNKLLGDFSNAGNSTTLSHYVQMLDEAGIVSGLQKYTTKAIVTKQSSPKFQVHNPALFTALTPASFTKAQSDRALWGRFVETAVGAHLFAEKSRLGGAKIRYWRESEGRNTYEVDFVFEYNGKTLGIEVKSGATQVKSFAKFKERFPNATTLIVGDDGIPWQEFIAGKIEHLL